MRKLNNYFKTPKHKGFDSKFEYAKYVELELLLKAKKIRDFQVQVPIDLMVNGYKICSYIMDFVVLHNDGTQEWIEMKGVLLPVSSMKIKILRAMYMDRPDVKITVEFQKPGMYKDPMPTKLKIKHRVPIFK
jgi:hypothetical protein